MKTIGRPKASLVLTEHEREELVRLTHRARVNRHLAFRAKLVLSCAEGVSSADVARRCRTSNQTVCKWRQRFIARRLDDLYDEPRVGAPRKISDDNVEALIVKTLETTPKGRTHWSTRKMTVTKRARSIREGLSLGPRYHATFRAHAGQGLTPVMTSASSW